MQQTESLKCPQCGQVDKVEKVAGIVARGTSMGGYSGPTGGVAIGSGGGEWGAGVIGAHTTLSGEGQTALAKSLSPPSKPKPPGDFNLGCGLFLAFCALIAFSYESWLAAGILGLISGLMFSRIGPNSRKYKKEMQEWRKDMARWEKSYYCARCHITFIP